MPIRGVTALGITATYCDAIAARSAGRSVEPSRCMTLSRTDASFVRAASASRILDSSSAMRSISTAFEREPEGRWVGGGREEGGEETGGERKLTVS